MTSISGIGSSISNFFTTGSTGSTSSTTSTTDESNSTTDTSNGYLGDVLGVTQTSGISGLPTADAPGDSDLLLAEIELKLQKTLNQTRDNSALSTSIAADVSAIASDVIALTKFELAINADNTTITLDTNALNNTYLPLQSQQLTAKNTADGNLSTAQNAITAAQSAQQQDVKNIKTASDDEPVETSIMSATQNIPADKAQYNAALGKYNADIKTVNDDTYDENTTQQGIINTNNNLINGVNGQPGLQSLADTADSAYYQTSSTVGNLQQAVKDANTDLPLEQTNASNMVTTIGGLLTDLAQKLSMADLSGPGVTDQNNANAAQDGMIESQFEKVTDELKKLVNVDTMVQQAQSNQDQAITQQTIDRSVLAAASLVGGLLDLVNTLSNLTPAPDADAGSQAYATGGSRLKIGV